MASGGLQRGIVKQVLSGDTVVIRGRATNGPPPERTLAFAAVSAPRLGRKDERDEPFAFESREFLRKLLVGKEVAFRVEYSTSTGREYGVLFLGEENVIVKALSNGHVKLRDGKQGKEGSEEYQAAEQAASEAGLGLWTKTEGAGAKSIRSIKHSLEEEPRAFLDKNKGQALEAIVERVRDGSTIQVLLLPSYQMVTVLLSGIKAPIYRKDVPEQEDLVEPFALEAKFTVESRLLQQDVKIILEGLSNKNFVGSVIHPNGNIAEALVKEGLAKVVDWSITMVTGGPKTLREAEKLAKQKRIRLWKDYNPKAVSAQETEFTAKVSKIVNGESIQVTLQSGEEKKISFSSVRQPRTKEANEAPYQAEAKEFLRSRLIGQKVHITVDYVKAPEEGFEERTCASVKLGEINIGEALVSKGLASVVRHRQDDENRASNYDTLLAAEDRAQKAKKGFHSNKEPPVNRVSDASETPAKAKQFLPFLKRQGKVAAVVEHVFSGSRIKVLIPKENARLSFVLGGVRVGRLGKTPQEKSEPFAVEAFNLVNSRILQHDVEVEIEAVDKGGNFIGSVFSGSDSIAELLLEQGLATINPLSADQSNRANQLYSAEARAKSGKKNIWLNFDEEAARAAQLAEEQAAKDADKGGKREELNILATEVNPDGTFYAQIIGEGVKALETLMVEFARFHLSPPSLPYTPKKGDLCSAPFSADGQWYRARVIKLQGNDAEVQFIDFGNTDTVAASKLRVLPTNFASLAPQAALFKLAGIVVPDDDNYGSEAKAMIADFVLGNPCVAEVVTFADKVYRVIVHEPSLFSQGDSQESLNADLLANGFATVDRALAKSSSPWVVKLLQSQDAAKAQYLALWEHGDITPDDADEFGMKKRPAAAGPAKK